MGRPKSRIPGQVTFVGKKGEISVDKLNYDIKNIRIRDRVAKNQKEAEKMLWLTPNMDELYDDILARGYLQEELSINKNKIVKEGNRRLAVLKKLNKEQKKGMHAGKKFSTATCKTIDPTTTKIDLNAWLATIHIGQKQEWDDYSQSTLLKEMHEKDNISYDLLAAITRRSKPTVIKKIEALDLTHEYHDLTKTDKKFKKDQDWSGKYPHMWEFLRKDLEDIRDDAIKKKLFMKFLNEGKIPNSRYVRHLKMIFNDHKLLRALEQYDMSKVIELITKTDPTVKSPTYKRIGKVIEILLTFPITEFTETVTDPARIRMLRRLRDSADRLLRQIESVEKPKYK